MDKRRHQPQINRCNCGIRAMEGEGNERKFTISFSSETRVERWFGGEYLDHSENAVDLTRINEMGCVLFNHNRDKVIGKVCRAWIEDKRGYAEIEFDDDEESEKIYKKVRSGTLPGVSVGYQIKTWEEVPAGSKSTDGFEGPCDIARQWSPYEISIVSVPADTTVGVGRSMEVIKNVNCLNIYERQLQINKNVL